MFKFKFLLIISVLISGCTFPSQSEPKNALVTTSFYPLYDFTSNILQDQSQVISIVGNGIEPHDFEPTPKDLLAIYNSKLFIYNGAGLDPWAEKIAPDLESKGIKTIKLANLVDLLPAAEIHEHHEDDQHKNIHEDLDPHFWLDPVIVIELTKAIESALQEIDPTNSDKYITGANDFTAALQNLDSEYRAELSQCSLEDIVTSHSAFNYLAARYEFNMIPISGISPDEEPTPAKLAEITNFVKKHNIQYILFETLASSKVAETIATETGINTLVLNPLEGLSATEIESGQNYISVMKSNLKSLKLALNCK